MNGAITCATCRAALPEYAAGALNAETSARVAAHLATCAACRAEVGQWAAITASLRQPASGDSAPPLALDRVLGAVRARLPHATGAHGAQSRSMLMPAAHPALAEVPNASDAPPRNRIFTTVGAVAAVTLIALLAALLFTRPQGGTGAGQRINATDLRGYQLLSVSFAAPDDGWAAGGTLPDPQYNPSASQAPYVTPILLHYQHGGWTREAHIADLTANVVVSDIHMISPQEGWAVAHTVLPPNTDGYLEGVILHYQHGVWFKEYVNANHPLNQLAMTSTTDGWAVGDQAVLHYDGRQWQTVNDPALAGVTWRAVAAGSANNVWLAGTNNMGQTGNDGAAPEKVCHYDGKTWQAISLPYMQARINALAVAAPDVAGAAGWAPTPPVASSSSLNVGVSYLFEMSAQNVIDSAAPVHGLPHSLGYTGIAFDAPDDGYIVGGDGIILHLHDSASEVDEPEVASPTHANLHAVTMLSGTDGWIVGDGVILHFVHGAWQNVIP